MTHESSLGSFATATVATSCQKFLKEGEFARSVSRQDEIPLVALMHNSEALTLAKCSRRLAEEYQIPISPDLLDLIQDLQEDQDIIVQNVVTTG